ncbi:MAG: hypothetical protein GC178_15895 [Flavobacteriales bacterium]|nr:hypothetical protein [Flavobacteriales bacterium]
MNNIGRGFLFDVLSGVVAFSSRIALFLFLLTVVGVPLDGVSQSLRDKFQIDSLFPSNVSDTLNVKEYQFNDWVYGGEGVYGLNELGGVQNYHPLYKDSYIRNDLGNIGSADYVALFDYDRSFGFHFRSGRKGFWKSIADRKILLSEKMFSNVQYSNGANRENYLMANLTRGFGKFVNLGVSFNRINTLGFYSRQKQTITDMTIYGTVRSRDNRYMAAVMFDYSNLLSQENGGIANDTVFEENLTTARNFITVNLNQSSNHWKGFEVGLEQRFFLMKQDSTVGKRGYRPAISHSFSAARHSMVYEGSQADLSFYQNIYMDSTGTYDSTNLLSVTNALRFELVKSDSVVARTLNRLAVGVQHDHIRVSYDSNYVDHINNLSVLGIADGKLFGAVDWHANGNFMCYGYNIWDLKVNGQFDYRFGGSKFSAFVDYSLFRPDYITANYQSNHFVWNNNWVQTQHWKTGLVYEQRKLRFKGYFTYHLFDNLVMFGTDKLPYQSKAVDQLMVFRAEEHFRMRWFHLLVHGAFQWKLTGDDIRVPLALGRGIFYYQNDLFKKKLRLQVGAQVSYATSYYANAYNPALSDFYIQNAKQVGNYPFIDAFLNLRVKKLRMFVKFTHINSGWMGYRYYHVPHYPVNDFAWHFGINWAFLD